MNSPLRSGRRERRVGGHFPGRPLVGYERGDALRAAMDGGFVPTGELRVWVR